jgi:two-component system, chemotaxis family, chemotaxis protein CheV
MSSMSNILLDKEILLESGTNELEVLVFDVADFVFGINVAKVREVLPSAEITSLPKSHPSIRGVFKLRNQVIPVVSLLEHLGIESTNDGAESTLILTDLNQQQTAFMVDGVERIHRLSWETILAVPALDALAHTPVTALARCDSRLIVMLDFEMILDDVTDQFFRTDEVENPLGLPREKLRILLAEDSPTVRQAIGTTLQNSGYCNLTSFENGAEAWNWMQQRIDATGQIEDIGDLLICDVEMPQVDGLHLTKKIKTHPTLKQLPVLLYSSIITPENRKKGAAVGADAQVAKPELAKVVQLADELISNAQRQSRASEFQEISDVVQTMSSDAPDATVVETPVAAEPVVAPAPHPERSSQSNPTAAETATPLNDPSSSTAGLPVDNCLPEPSTAPAVELNTRLDDTPEGDAPAPAGVSQPLWNVFHHELTGRVEHLRDVLQQSQPAGLTPQLLLDIARTLHTVKSAAMVIPIENVTRATHMVEGILEVAGNDGDCREESLRRYISWLEEVVSRPVDIDASLAVGGQLEAELTQLLAAESE